MRNTRLSRTNQPHQQFIVHRCIVLLSRRYSFLSNHVFLDCQEEPRGCTNWSLHNMRIRYSGMRLGRMRRIDPPGAIREFGVCDGQSLSALPDQLGPRVGWGGPSCSSNESRAISRPILQLLYASTHQTIASWPFLWEVLYAQIAGVCWAWFLSGLSLSNTSKSGLLLLHVVWRRSWLKKKLQTMRFLTFSVKTLCLLP